MQREPAHRHRHRDDARGLLIFDEVVVPRMFAVVHGALAVLPAVLRVENRSPGFDHGDRHPRPELRELLRQHRGGDAAADDADVGFVDWHFLYVAGPTFTTAAGAPPPAALARAFALAWAQGCRDLCLRRHFPMLVGPHPPSLSLAPS